VATPTCLLPSLFLGTVRISGLTGAAATLGENNKLLPVATAAEL
jgi:hypothetical protein